jgi:transcription elongation factor Elf1
MNGIKRYGHQGLVTVGTWPHETYPKLETCPDCGEEAMVELYLDSRQGRHYVKLCGPCVTARRAYRRGFAGR